MYPKYPIQFNSKLEKVNVRTQVENFRTFMNYSLYFYFILRKVGFAFSKPQVLKDLNHFYSEYV